MKKHHIQDAIKQGAKVAALIAFFFACASLILDIPISFNVLKGVMFGFVVNFLYFWTICSLGIWIWKALFGKQE